MPSIFIRMSGRDHDAFKLEAAGAGLKPAAWALAACIEKYERDLMARGVERETLNLGREMRGKAEEKATPSLVGTDTASGVRHG